MAFDWDTVDDFFNDDFTELATYSGTDYAVIRYSKTTEEMIMDAGLDDKVAFKLMIKASDFTPAEDADIIFPKSGTTYRIDKVNLDSTAKTYLVELIKPVGVTTA